MTSSPWLVGMALLAVLGAASGADASERSPDPHAFPAERFGDSWSLHSSAPDTVPEVELPPADTIPEPEGLPEVEGVEFEEVEEVVEPVDFPNYPATPAPGWATGTWEWDREGLLATRAFTLLELLEEIPGVTGLRSGDFGHPAAATAFGVAAGRVRVLMDGFELAPLDGGMPDLSRISLGGLDRVRVKRRMGELRIDLRGLRIEDPEPYTLIQAGTGDLSTNFFRGAFSHPDALGGNVAVSLDRLDTDGTARRNPGSVFGAHLRYSLHRGDAGGVGFEFRRFNTRRPAEAFAPGELIRTDWLVRTRWRAVENIVAEAWAGRSSLAPGGDLDLDDLPAAERGTFDPGPRSQLGARVRYQTASVWASADQRVHGGEGWPGTRTELRVGAGRDWLGGAEAVWEREGWPEWSGSTVRGSLWSRPFLGVSLFAQGESGRRGVPFLPAFDDEEADPDPDGSDVAPSTVEEDAPVLRIDERTAVRAGAEYRRERFVLSGAWVWLSADSLPPLGLPMDREGPVVPGGDLGGLELAGSVPLPLLDGLALEGSILHWAPEETPRYIPRNSWEGRLSFHDVFLPTGNLEVWADAGVRGRARMISRVPMTEPGESSPAVQPVPFQPHWFFRLQIRVTTLRVFLNWENVTNRTENQDFEGRLLPGMRTIWGIRWTMWN